MQDGTKMEVLRELRIEARAESEDLDFAISTTKLLVSRTLPMRTFTCRSRKMHGCDFQDTGSI